MKGSPAMKAHMAKLRGMRKVKGSGILDDIKNGFNRTFNPKLGDKIKAALTSPIAKQVYSGIADAGATGSWSGGIHFSGFWIKKEIQEEAHNGRWWNFGGGCSIPPDAYEPRDNGESDARWIL